MIVARPRAVPMPLPLIAFGPTRLNLSNMMIQKVEREAEKLTSGHSATYLER